MRLYLDASVLVALLTDDPLTARAEKIWSEPLPSVIVSDFAAAEFVSTISRRVRTRSLEREDASILFERLDLWIGAASRIDTLSSDIRAADALMRQLDLSLRRPDALNVALARRSNATLATFDRQLAAAARAVGLEVLD